jgi:hypothetical protein
MSRSELIIALLPFVFSTITFPYLQIFTSLSACRDLVVSKNLRPMLLMENAALEAFEGIDCSSPNAVVVGLAPSKFDYATVRFIYFLWVHTI